MKWVGLTFFMLVLRAASATEVTGRFMFGGYIASETLSSNSSGSTSNNAEMFSARMYLNVSDIDNSPWQMVTDLRDKDDFFGKAVPQEYTLANQDTLQVAQLYTRYNNPKSMLSATVGRFFYPEAGVNGVDGALAQVKVSKDWNSGIFAGLNPRRDDQTYYQWNPDDKIAGISTTYQAHGGDWSHNVLLNHAFVVESEGSIVTRTYLFHNSIYQWAPQDRIIAMLYLDFVPSPYVQNGNVLWQQGYTDKLTSSVDLFTVDVITYTHQQNVLERLAPSPYKEGNIKLDYALSPQIKWEMGFMDGLRDADGLSRQEYYVGVEQNRYWGRDWNVFFKLGGRNNFVSQDEFTDLFVGYYPGQWEIDLTADYAIQRYTDVPQTLHPLTAEVDVSDFFSRSMYASVSIQRAADEMAQIWSGFFTIGYRFGGDKVAQRQPAPPRGRL